MSITDHINRAARRIPTWCVYLLYIVPAPYYFYLALTGGLGPDPVKPLEHEYGKIALQLLIIGLCITPLRQVFGINLIKFRRTFGVLAFSYVTMHLLVWAVLDVQTLDRVIADIIKRPYISIGMVGFILLLPLALTSNNWSVRKLGATWRKLHLLTYVAVLLGGVHFIWLVKGIQLEPLIYMAVILALLGLRLRRSKGVGVANKAQAIR